MSSEAKIVGYCRACGRPLGATTVRSAQGTIFCEEHVPGGAPAPPPVAGAAPAQPYTAPSYHGGQYSAPYQPADAGPPHTALPYSGPYSSGQYSGGPPPLPSSPGAGSPGVAFVLGLIPGVGAVYNGQYAKGIVHVVILGLLISIVNSGSAHGVEPLFGILIPCFWFYMAFEAYHTAKQRRMGVAVDEFSSIMPMERTHSRFPVGPILLIVIGTLFLLDNLDLLEIRRLLRYWPALLIVMGFYMLYVRMTSRKPAGTPAVRSPYSSSPYQTATRDLAADEAEPSHPSPPPPGPSNGPPATNG